MPSWSLPDWRDAGSYEPVLAGGRQALAWEVLRRNPGYRAFVADGGAGDIVTRWGLHFRG